MKSIKFIVGSVIVYVVVATAHGCKVPKPQGTGGAGGSVAATVGAQGGLGGAGTASGTVSGNGGVGGLMNPVGDAEAEESGSRLKAKRHVGDDGSKQFVGWYDTTLQQDCTFSTAADGVDRCIPWPVYGVWAGYADATCTVPLFRGYPSCPVPKTVSFSTVDPCGKLVASNVYPIGMPFVGQAYSAIGLCTPLAGGSSGLYLVGPAQPLTMFVGATVVQDP